MNDHLPECFWSDVPERAVCICDRLRACEQRVLAAVDLPAANVQYQRVGYRNGLDAAREAVVPQNVRSAYLVSLSPQEQRIAVSALELAARAIDALREEQK